MHTFLEGPPDNFSVGYWAPEKAFLYGDKDPDYDGDFGPQASHGGEWMPLRDCKTAAEAASWVSYLNGGKRPDQPW